jgi:hypothetical protein
MCIHGNEQANKLTVEETSLQISKDIPEYLKEITKS